MHQQLISEVVAELREKLTGRFLGKLFQLTPLSFALDFGLRTSEYLFVSVDPSSPRLYLVQRKVKELEKQSIPLSHFGQTIRAKLSGAAVVSIEKDVDDRVVRFSLIQTDEAGAEHGAKLVVQLTGKAANVLLLDETDQVVDTLRPPKGRGQTPGEHYSPPPRTNREVIESPPFQITGSPSATADAHYRAIDDELNFINRVNNIKGRLRLELNQKSKLVRNLKSDLETHGEPESHKRLGDLLLANVATAKRNGRFVEIVDYYAEGTPTITVEVDEESSVQEEAARKFKQYTKAKRAREEISERLTRLEGELSQLEAQQQQLERIFETRDVAALEEHEKVPASRQRRKTKQSESAKIPGVRQYLSSDGYEVLVGRAARDNDNLTFRVARPNDLWLHSGDYPGSHVIVRNPTRKEIPHRTIIEAAQLAGKFSQASEDSKVVVHYTQRKFLSKPKGAAAGLVRMSTFRSITVEPKEAIQRVF